MFLIYLGDAFFGNTRSKKVAKQFRDMYKSARVLHVDEYRNYTSPELSDKLSDDYLIQIFAIADKFGEYHETVTTPYEIREATEWITHFYVRKISTLNPHVPDVFDLLPGRIKSKLGEYEPIDVMFECTEDDHFDLTYEGLIMYRMRNEKGSEAYFSKEDLRLLQEMPPWIG